MAFPFAEPDFSSRSVFRGLGGAVVLLLAAGCGSVNPDSSSVGLVSDASVDASPDASPDAGAVDAASGTYPTAGLGTRVGDVIANLSYPGIRDTTQCVAGPVGTCDRGPLVPIALGDYFDPRQDHTPPVKLIHVMTAARWDLYGRAEVRQAMQNDAALRARGVVWITLLVEWDLPGAAATEAELRLFAAEFPQKAPLLFGVSDPSFGNAFKDTTLYPNNLWIDARDMKILELVEGAPKDVLQDADLALKKWASR